MNSSMLSRKGLGFFCLALALFSCDGSNSGPGAAGAGGAGAGNGGVDTISYPFVVISDISEAENIDGMPGVDICRVQLDCNGETRLGTVEDYDAGTGQICGQAGVELTACAEGVVFNDPAMGVDGNSLCDPAERTADGGSPFVSLGMGGQLVVRFESDVQGCSLDIAEHVGAEVEGYRFKLCAETAGGQVDLNRCIGEQSFENGGNGTIVIPEPPVQGAGGTGGGAAGGTGGGAAGGTGGGAAGGAGGGAAGGTGGGAAGGAGGGAAGGTGGGAVQPTPEEEFGPAGADFEVEGDLNGTGTAEIQGDVSVGPFEFEGSGTAEKASPDAVTTWCVEGTTDLTTDHFTLEGLTLTVCRDADEVINTDFQGTLVIEEQRSQVQGTLTEGDLWSLSMTATDLALFGLAPANIEFAYEQDANQVSISTTAAIAPTTPVAISGLFTPTQDFELVISAPEEQPWQPIPALDSLVFPMADGIFARTDGEINANMGAETDAAIDLNGVSMAGAAVEADLTQDGQWSVRLIANTTVAPSAATQMSGLYDPMTDSVCLAGTAGAALPNLVGDLTQTVCVTEGQVESIEFTGQAEVEPFGPVDMTGTYDADADRLCFEGQSATNFPGSDAPFAPRVCLGNNGQDVLPTEFNARVDLPPVGEVALNGTYDAETNELCMNGTSSLAFPGSGANFDASVCVDMTDPLTPQITSMNFDATVDLEPIGSVRITGPFDEETQTLCLTGETDINFPGVPTAMNATACVDFSDPLSPSVSSVSFGGTITLDPMGDISLTGEYNPEDNSLCLTGATTVQIPNSDAVLMAGTCLDTGVIPMTLTEFTFSAETALPPVADRVLISGRITDEELCLTGETDLTPPGAPVALSGTMCLDITGPSPELNSIVYNGEAVIEPFGLVRISGQVEDGELCVGGAIEGDSANWLPIPGIVIHDVQTETCLADEAFSGFSAKTTFTLGEGNSAMTLEASGAYVPEGATELSLGLAPGCAGADGTCGGYQTGCETTCDGQWTPFVDINGAPDTLRDLTFSPLSGSLTKDGNTFTMAASAGLLFDGGDGSVEIIPNVLSLREVSTELSYSTNGDFLAKLAGRTSFDIAGTELDVRMSAAVTNEDLTFTGSVNVEDGTVIDPLAPVIGPGLLAVEPSGGRVTVQTNFIERTVLFDLQTMATLELGLLNLSVTPLIAVRTQFGGGQPAITLVGTIPELEIDFFGQTMDLGEAGAIVIAASTEAIDEYEIDGDGDPETPGDVYDIPRGLTLIARGELTPLVALFSPDTDLNVEMMVNVKSAQNVELSATINSNFQLIRPEYGIPSLKSLRTDSLGVKLILQAANQAVELFGTMVAITTTNPTEANPDGVESEITGRAEFNLDRNLVMGGLVALEGDWKEPFRLPKVAVMNPGFGLNLRFNPEASGIPVPTAFKLNGDLVFLRDGFEWPPVIETDNTGSPIIPEVDGEPTLVTGGGTVILDLIPSESGICLVGACLPLPTVILRANLENLRMTDLLALEHRVRNGTLSLVAGVANMAGSDMFSPIIPGNVRDALTQVGSVLMPSESEMETPSFDPFELNLNKLQLYFSTHELSEFGVDFAPGMRVELDASAALPPEYERKELKLLGAVSPTGITLSGLMSSLELNLGELASFTLAGDPFQKYADSRGGFVEVRHNDQLNQPRTIEGWVHTAAIPGDVTGGVIAEKMDMNGSGYGLYAGAMAASCDPATLPSADREDPNACPPRGQVTLMLANDGRQRLVTSRFGKLTTDGWHHVAATIQPTDGTVALFIDGKQVVSTDSSDDDRFLMGANNNAPLFMGAGIDRVDDVRLWASVRDSGAIGGQARVLPIEYNQTDLSIDEVPLIAQYQFNYDDITDRSDRFFDDVEQAYIAHNGRMYPADMPALHGYFRNGAEPSIDLENNDLYVKLALLLDNPFASGLWVKAGMAIDTIFDPLDRVYGTETNFSVSGAASNIYVREFPLLALGPLGEFSVSGNGPNLRKGDYDDGFYAAFDLGISPFPTMAATGRLSFIDSNQNAREIAEGNMWLRCPGVECPSVNDYVFHSDGLLNLTVPLPDGLGDLGIVGEHVFDSQTEAGGPRFSVDGQVVVFGKTMASGSIYFDSQRLALTTNLDIGNVAGVDLGTASSLGMEMVYNPPRMCGDAQTDLAVPGLTTFNGAVKVCLGDNPSTYFAATGDITLAGFQLAATDVCLSVNDQRGCPGAGGGDGLYLSSQLNVPGILSSDITGYYQSLNSFDLTGDANVTVAGFTLLDSSVRLSPQAGAFVDGRVAIPAFGNAGISGSVQPNGQYSLTGTANLSPLGFNFSDASVAVTPGRLALDGRLNFLVGSTDMNVVVNSDGTFRGEAGTGINVAGFNLANGRVVLSDGGVAINGGLAIPAFGSVNVAGSVQSNGAYSMTGSGALRPLGFNVSNTAVTVSNNQGLRVQGDLNFLVGNTRINTIVNPNGTFRSESSANITVAGFQLLNNTVVFTHNGVTISGHIDIPVFGRADVSGTVQSNGNFSLSGNNNLSPFGLTLSQTSITVSDAGLRIQGSLNVLIGSTSINTVVNSNGTFRSVSNANLSVAGTTLANSTVTLSHTGVALASRASLGGLGFNLTGSVSGAAGVSLAGNAGVGIPITVPSVCLPQVCTPNCVDLGWPIGRVCHGFGQVCTPGACMPGSGANLGNLNANVRCEIRVPSNPAAIANARANFTASAGGDIGGFGISGGAQIRVNPPRVCAGVDFGNWGGIGPGVVEFCVGL